MIRNADLVEDTAIVVKGEDIPSFTPRVWDWILRHRELVFARTTPEHKLRIVKVRFLLSDPVPKLVLKILFRSVKSEVELSLSLATVSMMHLP